jgi:UV DNA damage repair endonuclease
MGIYKDINEYHHQEIPDGSTHIEEVRKIQKELVRKINESVNFISQQERTGSGQYIILNSKAAEIYQSTIDTMEEYQVNSDRLKKLNDIFGELK